VGFAEGGTRSEVCREVQWLIALSGGERVMGHHAKKKGNKRGKVGSKNRTQKKTGKEKRPQARPCCFPTELKKGEFTKRGPDTKTNYVWGKYKEKNKESTWGDVKTYLGGGGCGGTTSGGVPLGGKKESLCKNQGITVGVEFGGGRSGKKILHNGSGRTRTMTNGTMEFGKGKEGEQNSTLGGEKGWFDYSNREKKGKNNFHQEIPQVIPLEMCQGGKAKIGGKKKKKFVLIEEKGPEEGEGEGTWNKAQKL